jgi:hypothetical protein
MPTECQTLREALARPLRKPAVRKLHVGVTRGSQTQWFLLTPVRRDGDLLNGAATPCASFADALEMLQRGRA